MADADSRLTPHDPAYRHIADMRAYLAIYPESMTSEDVTRLLKIEPTKAHNKDDAWVTARGHIHRKPRTLWMLSSEHEVQSADLRDHLDWLLRRLEGAIFELGSLQRAKGTRMRVSCVWHPTDDNTCGAVLWPEQMALLAKMGLECSFDVYLFEIDRSTSRREGAALELLKKERALTNRSGWRIRDDGVLVDAGGRAAGALADYMP